MLYREIKRISKSDPKHKEIKKRLKTNDYNNLKRIINLVNNIYSQIPNIIIRNRIGINVMKSDEYKNKRNEIAYGKKKLIDIYKNDINSNGLYVSFQFNKTKQPKEPLYFTNNNAVFEKFAKGKEIIKYKTGCKFLKKERIFYMPLNKKIIDKSENKSKNLNKKINNQSMRSNLYFREAELLYNLIDVMEKKSKFEVVKKFSKPKTDDNDFFDVTMQKYNEVMYTNALYYFFFKNNVLLKKFIDKVLGNKPFGQSYEAKIAREESKIDLSIKIKKKNNINHFIIIENKIKSDINGIKDKDETERIYSQLQKYYDLAKLNYNEKNIHCYLLTPNYYNVNLREYSSGDKYIEIKYKDILDLFNDVVKKDKSVMNAFNKNDKFHFKDFIKSVDRHSYDFDNEFRKDCMRRLNYRIVNSK